jgi:hypothetical protein
VGCFSEIEVMTRRGFVLLCLGLGFLAGCGKVSLPPMPKNVKVKGKVLLPDGQPISAGRLQFTPEDKANSGGIEPFADIHEDGSFSPITYGGKEGQGLPVGTYIVHVDLHSYTGGDAAPIKNDQNIPERYLSAAKSDAKIEIKPDDTDVTLKLKP